jgi:Fe-S cluster assembly protein SufB
MSASVQSLVSQPYKYGFVTDIEADVIPRGLSEDTVRMISAKKNEPEFMLEFRLKAYRKWLTMAEPDWPNVDYPPIDYQDIVYYSAPKQTKEKLNSLDEADPALLETFEKLGLPLSEQKRLANVAVDAIFDSVSIGTTYKEKLAEHGVIFCSISEAMHEHPELVEKYLGTWCPWGITISRPSTQRCLATAPLCTFPRTRNVRWTCPPISASTMATRGSLSVP